ncbi:MAG: hypothetical protein WEG40_06360 [Candidatus Rokuibacteriota bacterium]
MTGLCRFWHAGRRFGRIAGDDGVTYWVGLDVLLGRHALKIDDSVRFTPVAHEKGPRAIDVRVVEVPVHKPSGRPKSVGGGRHISARR